MSICWSSDDIEGSGMGARAGAHFVMMYSDRKEAVEAYTKLLNSCSGHNTARLAERRLNIDGAVCIAYVVSEREKA